MHVPTDEILPHDPCTVAQAVASGLPEARPRDTAPRPFPMGAVIEDSHGNFWFATVDRGRRWICRSDYRPPWNPNQRGLWPIEVAVTREIIKKKFGAEPVKETEFRLHCASFFRMPSPLCPHEVGIFGVSVTRGRSGMESSQGPGTGRPLSGEGESHIGVVTASSQETDAVPSRAHIDN